MKTNNKPQGFSLVEVVFALGIVSVGLVGIIGLISFSLGNAKQSKDDTALALMTQTAIAQIRALGYTTISTDPAPRNFIDNAPDYFFDSSGNLLRDTSGVPLASATIATRPIPVYSCTVNVKTPTALPGDPAKMVVLRLDFTWPWFPTPTKVQKDNQQHKYAFTSVAQYDDL